MESKASIVKAEAQSGNWLTSSWRPIVMLLFTIIVVARWFGLTVANMPPSVEVELFNIIKIGLSGYVIGRSAEKCMKVYKENK
jgi:hypothetical protein